MVITHILGDGRFLGDITVIKILRWWDHPLLPALNPLSSFSETKNWRWPQMTVVNQNLNEDAWFGWNHVNNRTWFETVGPNSVYNLGSFSWEMGMTTNQKSNCLWDRGRISALLHQFSLLFQFLIGWYFQPQSHTSKECQNSMCEDEKRYEEMGLGN